MGRPPTMAADELARFLEGRPTGALCITAGTTPLVVPATVVASEGSTIEVRIPAGFPVAGGAPACVVADEFERYEEIRGAVVQGAVVACVPETDGLRVVVERRRVTTFAFGR